MLKKFKEKFIGDRAFYAMVLAVAVPIMVQNGITTFVGLLDNIMVGRLGTEQMSGISIVNQLLFVYTVCSFGAMSGVGIFTAQYYGQGDQEGIRHTFRYKIWLGFLLTGAVCLLFAFFGKELIQLYLNESADGGDLGLALACGIRYLDLMLLGLPAFALLQVYASTLRQCGKTVVPMKAGVLAVFVNLLFNYLLIYGKFGFPELGVAGAALATVIARYVEAAIVIVWTHTHRKEARYIEGVYQTLRVPLVLVRKYFVKGFPLMINEGIWASGVAIMTQCYSVRGLGIVAGLNIARTINDIFSVGCAALGDSVAIMIGQLLGAGKMKEARDTDNKLMVFSVFVGLGAAAVMILVSPFFPRLYNTTAGVQRAAMYFIIIQAVFMAQDAFLGTLYFTMSAGGRTLLTFVYDCVFMWGLSVPVIFYLSHCTAMDAILIYVAMHLTDWGKGIFGSILVYKGVWLQNIVSDGG